LNNVKRSVAVQEAEVSDPKESKRELTLFLEGELTPRQLKGLGEHLLKLAQRGIRRVAVDLSDVSHLDYRGVRPLMERAVEFRKLGGEVKLTGLTPYLATILRVAGAHSVFSCYREPSSVKEAFSGRSRLAH
jgi:anti-sigma B factor antagonist